MTQQTSSLDAISLKNVLENQCKVLRKKLREKGKESPIKVKKDTILNWTQSLGYVCTFVAFDYTDVIRLSKSCYDANMNRAA